MQIELSVTTLVTELFGAVEINQHDLSRRWVMMGFSGVNFIGVHQKEQKP